jgi:hypothetical protein
MNTLACSSNSAMTRTGSIGATALAEQNHRFRGTGGVSRENRSLGFSPAFRDCLMGFPMRWLCPVMPRGGCSRRKARW